jgi:hypothetical protein
MAGEDIRFSLTGDASSLAGAAQVGADAIGRLGQRAEEAKKSFADISRETTNLAQTLGFNFRNAQQFAQSLGLSAQRANEAVQRLQALNRVQADSATKFKVLSQELGITQAQFLKLDAAASNLGNSSDRLRGFFQGLGQGAGQAAFGAVTNTLSAIPSLVATSTLQFEKFNTVLTTLYGDAGKAKEAFAGIQQFAATTPFQLDEVVGGFIKLKNRGIDPTNEVLTKLGDLASSQGKSLDQIVEALLDAQGAEFERLKEFGVKASVAGDQVNLTFKGVTQTVAKTPQAITEAVLSLGALQGVAGGMEAQSKTLGGQLSNLQDTVTKAAVAFGSELVPVLLEFVKGANEGGESLEDFAKTAGQQVADGLRLVGQVLKFGADNAKLLEVVLQVLIARFIALRAITIVQGLQAAAAGFLATAAGAGTATGAVTAFGVAAATALAPLVALTAAIAAANFAKLILDLEDVNDELDSVGNGANVSGQAAINLASKIKAINSARAEGKKFTDEELRQQQQLVTLGKQQIKSLQDQLDQAKAIRPVNEDQANAQKALIANIEASIRALNGQTSALEQGLAAKGKDAKATQNQTEALKKQAEELKNARAKEKQGKEDDFKDAQKQGQEDFQDAQRQRQEQFQDQQQQKQQQFQDQQQARRESAQAQEAQIDKRNAEAKQKREEEFKSKEGEIERQQQAQRQTREEQFKRQEAVVERQQQEERLRREDTFNKQQRDIDRQQQEESQRKEAAFKAEQQRKEAAFKQSQQQRDEQQGKNYDRAQRLLQLEGAKDNKERE